MRNPIRKLVIAATIALGTTAGAALAQSGVIVEVEQFGAGAFRAGGITPLRLKLTSNLEKSTAVWVQWEVPNVDGDIGEYGRSLTITAGQPAFTWLYAPLPPNTNPSTVWTVRVFAEEDGERRGELGGARISPALGNAQMVDLAAGMMLIVGDRRMGLDDYGIQGDIRMPRPIGAHEDTRVVSGLKVSQLPDRWYGLMDFEAIAWVGDAAAPQDLSIDQADALREYVQRGGHLIISLPAAGNPWGLGTSGQTLLEDLLPVRAQGAAPRRDEAVLLRDLLPILSKTLDVRQYVRGRSEPDFAIRVFKDLKSGAGATGADASGGAGGNASGGAEGETGFNVIDNRYEPLIALPDGRVVGIQRIYGFGRVTVLGLDLSDGRLVGLSLPQADAFWNRVLGRRADTPTATELQATEKEDRLAMSHVQDKNLGSGALFTSQINLPGRAGIGMLLALVLFIVYWLVAGPGGFAVLKHYKQVKHAWVAFAGCIAVFTLLAWGSVGVVPKHLQVSHVTFLDHIARPPNDPLGAATDEPQYQRATSFFSVNLPDYGSTPVAMESSPQMRDVILSWTPPAEANQTFPNVDRYRVDVARGFDAYALPSRSTTTQLYAHWMGGLDTDWGGLLRVDPNMPVRVVKDAGGNEMSLAGRIMNELPGTLRDVTVIWVKNNRVPSPRYARLSNVEQPWVPTANSGRMVNTGSSWRLNASDSFYLEGGTLDLTKLGQAGSLANDITQRYINQYIEREFAGGTSMSVAEPHRMNFMEMLSFFNQLDPPTYLRNNVSESIETASFHRELGRELDLSPWFTRPCLIILGYLDGSETPLPLRIDGNDERPLSTGLTMVRWIYPLPLDEKIAFRNVFEGEQESGDETQ